MWIKAEIKALHSKLNKFNKEIYDRCWELREYYSFLKTDITYEFGREYVNNKICLEKIK